VKAKERDSERKSKENQVEKIFSKLLHEHFLPNAQGSYFNWHNKIALNSFEL